MTPRVAAVILCRDRPEPTARTVRAVLAQEPRPDPVVLIDNDATPAVRRLLREVADGDPGVEVLQLDTNQGCAGGFERGLAKVMDHEGVAFVCGFDDDATPQPGCVAALLEAARVLPDIGSLGAASHDEDGTLAWPMLVEGEDEPVRTLTELRTLSHRRTPLCVPNHSWHGMLLPIDVLRRHGNVWGDLFLQYEDIELGMRLRAAGLHCYLVPEALCRHPAPPAARPVRILGRQLDVTAQSPAKEYLTLRNGLVVRRRYDGARFWYGTGPFVLLRGFLSSLALDLPWRVALRRVFVQGILDALRGRLGPPPPSTSRAHQRG